MNKLIGSLLLSLILVPYQSFAAGRFSDRAWGGYLGAYNCEIKGEETPSGCKSLHVWYITYGYNGSTVFWNTPVALTIDANSPAEKGKWRGTLYINDEIPVVEPIGMDYVELSVWRHMQKEKENPSSLLPTPKIEIRTVNARQHAAIEAIFRRELAPYFGQDGLVVKSDKVNIKPVCDKGTIVYVIGVGQSKENPIATANIVPDHKVWFMSTLSTRAPISMPSFSSVKRIDSCEELFKLEEGLLPLCPGTKFRIPSSDEPYSAMKDTMMVGMVAPEWQRVPLGQNDWHDEKYRTFGKPAGTAFLGLFEFRGAVDLDHGPRK